MTQPQQRLPDGTPILLSEWAGDSNVPRLLGGGYDRSPCPICGHPTGDCTHDVPGGHLMANDQQDKSKTAAAAAAKHADDNPTAKGNTGAEKQAGSQLKEVGQGIQSDPTEAGANEELATAGVGDDAVLSKLDEELPSSIYEVAGGAEYVTLQRDIVEEFFYPDTKRPSYRLLYTKGQVVSKAAIEAYNDGVRAANARRAGEVDEANPAGIDSTTIAAGTRVPGLDTMPGDK